MNTLRSTLFATVTLATVALAAPSAFAMMMMPMGGGSSPMPSGGGMMMDQMPMPSGGQMGNMPQQGMQQQPGMQMPQAAPQPPQQAMPPQGMMMNPQQMQNMQGMGQPGMQMQPGQQMMPMGQQMMNAAPAMAPQAAQYPVPQVQIPPTPAAQATAWTYSRLVNILNQPLTGAPDKDFLQGMIAQHEAAIDLARIELLHGTNPEVRKIAEQVVASHETELQTLKTQAWGQAASIQPVDPTAPAADQSAHSTHVIK